MLKPVNNALTSYIKLYNYGMLNSNEPIKVPHLQKLANQLMLNGALVIELVSNSFSESKKNFCRLIKWGVPKIYSSTKFCKLSQLFRSAKLLMLKSDFRKKGVYSKTVTKTLYRNKFLVSKYIFKLTYHCEASRWSEICCARDIRKKPLDRLLLLLILKSSY